MKFALSGIAGLFLIASRGAFAQPVPPQDPQPIYRVTVVSRTLPAINYGHLDGPTPIDFRGTVLLPPAKGFAYVESKRGRVAIDAKFEHLEAPTRFGPEYLTYVLWAITPEGRPINLGELLVDSSNKAKISVTSDMQAFGLMVTAEPYYAVTKPSDVVVVENVIRPDTTGRIEPVNAKYELMPRGEYTMTVNAGRLRSYGEAGEKLPYDRYEAVLELYQAQNAIQIAQSVGADRLAADSYRKALALFNEAQDMNLRKQDSHFVVSRAREAAQLAEDARAIAVKRSDEERTREARHEEHQAVKAERRAEQAEAAAAAAQQAAVAQEQANNAAAEQAAAEQQAAAAQANAVEQARAEAAAELRTRAQALAQPAAPPAIVGQPVPVVPPQPSGAQRQARAELLNRLNGVMATRDTPRGLVVTFSDTCFEANGNVQRPYAERLGLIASLLSSRPDLQVYVEGFTDDRGSQAEQRAVSERRAQEVRATLVANGLRSSSVQALGYGGSRPIVSNASAGGREQNRRVEIVISGPSVGGMALWDRTYPLNATR